MKTFIRARTRRHLFRIAAAGAASIPLIASAASSTFAEDRDDHDKIDRYHDKHGYHKHDGDDHDKKNGNHSCFLKGTRISTPFGERPVQELQIGDKVHTRNGLRPIKWIGYDKFRKTEGKAWIERVMPICVRPFAIDDHTPHRDLYVSPAHCFFLDDVLIPVACLINDISILPHTPSDLDSIEYYHIELETHEVIYAEGASVESYLGSNRETFTNFVQFERLYGAESQFNKTPFAPIVGYYGGRDEVKGLFRSIISNFVDVRDPIQIAWDRIAERAGTLLV